LQRLLWADRHAIPSGDTLVERVARRAGPQSGGQVHGGAERRSARANAGRNSNVASRQMNLADRRTNVASRNTNVAIQNTNVVNRNVNVVNRTTT
jgi:hypothetical protein